MRLEYPVPFDKDTITSSPLTLGEFPCKQRPGAYGITQMNHWNAGETKTISFRGSAVHGGGSCQFSLTTDPKPSLSSQWKVIQSVIGGCPANVTGNIEPEDPDGHRAGKFPVQMPKDIPAGTYTFAWTWLNKVGNREFYMNCAPVQVGSGTGGAYSGSASDALSKLPNMFVANLGTSCNTKEGQDFDYPDPGANVVRAQNAAPGRSLDGTGCATVTAMGAGKGQMGSPTNPATPANSSAAYGQPAPAKPTPGYGQPAPQKPSSGYGQQAPAKPTPGYGQQAPAKPTPGYGQPAPQKPSSGYDQPAPQKPTSGYGQTDPVESSPAEDQPAPEESSPADEQPAPEKSSPADEQPTPEESSPAYGNTSPSNHGGVFAPGASKAPVAQPTTPTASEPTPAASGYGSTPSGDGECTPCPKDGAVVCIGKNQFGICNQGCVVAQALATGTMCSNGTVAGVVKRSINFPRAHLHRRHGSADYS